MNSINFCYWLSGYFEIAESGEQLKSLDEGQIQVIQEHLSLVFNKVTKKTLQDQFKEITPTSELPWSGAINQTTAQPLNPKDLYC